MKDEQVFWLTIIGGFITNLFAGILTAYILKSQVANVAFIDQYGDRLEAVPIRGYGGSILPTDILVELRKNGVPVGKALLERKK
ncbi:MAG: hypothetical protein K6T29_09455 [Peptococcaceae bacterium]|nr:hypothetical protein [Peptococcaceae bacterium]